MENNVLFSRREFISVETLSKKQDLERLKAGRGLTFLSGVVNMAVGSIGPRVSSGSRSAQWNRGESPWHVGRLAPPSLREWENSAYPLFQPRRASYGSVGSEFRLLFPVEQL